eukprot:471722-Lingulodinium_polyedra.AAC.1
MRTSASSSLVPSAGLGCSTSSPTLVHITLSLSPVAGVPLLTRLRSSIALSRISLHARVT